MLAGLAARLTVTGETVSPARLLDALILLQAREAGLVLLTRNIADFDRLQQLEPTSRVLYYR
jgi:predicted nucleic acid-binding protein